jgi:hypothetical protein
MTTPTTIIERAERALESVTEGPWKRDPYDHPNMQVIARGNEVIFYHGRHPRQDDKRVVPNASFIAEARALVPELVAALRLELARKENLHTRLELEHERVLHLQQSGDDLRDERDRLQAENGELRSKIEFLRDHFDNCTAGLS